MYASPFAPPSAARHAAVAYRQASAQMQVATATPHSLIALLFDGYVSALNRARGALRNGRIDEKARALSQAVRIVDEGLKAGLDLRAGGALAADLSDLYAYVCLRLTQANLHNDEAALDECLHLVQPLREAWSSIADRPEARRAA